MTHIQDKVHHITGIKAVMFVLSLATFPLPLVGITMIYLGYSIPIWLIPILVFPPLLGAAWLMALSVKLNSPPI